MGNLRPFQVIVMGIFALVALIGLVVFANFQGFSSNAPQVGTVTIWGTLPAKPVNDALTSMKQGRAELGRVSYVERPEESFDADVAEAIASGNGPDLLLISQEDLPAAESKLTYFPSSIISEREFRDSFLPINELYLREGGTYGMPLVVDPLVMFYNRPVIAAAGVARPPATWEAISGLAATVNQQTGAQTVTKSLIALGTYENIENARAILSLLFLQAGYKMSERGEAGYRSDLMDVRSGVMGASPAESALNFYTEFANPTKTVYSWNRALPNNRQSFLAGDVALYLGFASERAGLIAANPNLDFDMTAAPNPGTAATRMTFGKAYAFAIPRASKNAQGAVAVSEILTTKDASLLFARSLGMAPAARAALAPQEGDLYEPVYFPEALIARGWLSPAPLETDRVFATMVGNVMSGRESVITAIQTAARSLTAAY